MAAVAMASISDDKLQELRDRVDVVAVVQRRVPLKKSGRDFKGLCPFHGEKTPSFYVVPDKKLWHCFGCGASGDAIKFVMQMEGRSFREAIEQLATEAGVDLTPQDPEEIRRSQRRAALAEVNEKACVFYERVLWEHPKGEIARKHLADRGISEETARAWRLGYAPSLWDSLCKSVAMKGIDTKLIEEAGLGIPRKKGPGLYDRFRGRLMIPIKESGRVVGFGGRLLEGESEAKYLNSPDTPLYQKGTTLFAMDRAREALRSDAQALFVEGYFDAIGLHQAGVKSAVATCGTSMTEKHVELVRKAGAQELVFVFDGDAAGLRAAQRASEIAAAAGVPARVLVPPRGEDPDETVKRVGTQGFRELLGAAQPSLEFLLDRALASVPAGAAVEARVKAVEAVKGLVAAAPSALAKDLYVEKVAAKIGTSAEIIRRALSGKAAPPASQQEPQARPAPTRISAAMEYRIAAQMLQSAALCRVVEEHGANFAVAALREVAEQAFEQARHGSLDADALLRAIEDDAARQTLIRTRSEVELAGNAEGAERVLRAALAKHDRLLGEEEVKGRKQRASSRVPRSQE